MVAVGDGTFTTWDYVVFGVMLAISAAIGLYHACAGGKQRTQAEFLLANRSMSALPVALSVFASFFSASTMLGTPAEVYQQGIMYWMAVWGAIFAPLVGAFLFGPLFHRMKIVSVFEYLERRFKSKAVRLLGSFLFIFKNILAMGIVMYGPSVALTEVILKTANRNNVYQFVKTVLRGLEAVTCDHVVTGFPTWANIISIGFVCCFYTALGGMKAVIWTDVFQTSIMMAGLLAAIIQGSIEVGGIVKVWDIADQFGRIEFCDFNPDPTVRHTFWTLVVGNFFIWLPPYSVDQQMIQRFASTKSLKQAVIALLINIPSIFVMITLCSLLGLIMFAYYADCNPLTTGQISNPNQLVPRFVVDIFSFAPGIPGLFVSSLFCGALSSVSSILNSLSAVTWEDFAKLHPKARKLSDRVATLINKLLAVVFAGLGIGMAFVFSTVGGTVLQMSLAFNGAVGAPLVGLFVLGSFFPWTNWIGAFIGGLLGFAFPMWISIGAYATSPDVMRPMNNSVAGCPVDNSSQSTISLQTVSMTTFTQWISTEGLPPSDGGGGGIVELYTLSYLWYTAVGILTTIFVGLIVSFITGYTHARDIDPGLMISYVDNFWCCFPESCKKKCRCGIDYESVKYKEDDRTFSLSSSDSEDKKRDESGNSKSESSSEDSRSLQDYQVKSTQEYIKHDFTPEEQIKDFFNMSSNNTEITNNNNNTHNTDLNSAISRL